MANEFIARKGLIVPSGSILVASGSVNVSRAVTASFFKGDGSNLTNLPATSIASSIINTSTFTGDGTTTTFNLGNVYVANSLMVSVDGLFYTPSSDFTVSGTDITFTSAPPSSSDITVRSMVNIVSGGIGSYSGSFIGTFDGNFVGTSSLAVTAFTASYVEYSNVANKPELVSASSQISYTGLSNTPAGIVSSSTQVIAALPTGTVSSSTQVVSSLPTGTVSSSAQVTALLPTGTVSSSTQIDTGSFSGSFTGTFTGTSSWADNAITSSYVDYTNVANKPTLVSASSQIDVRNTTGIATIATTGSNTFTGVQTISDTTNSTSYLDGALIVAGGVGITKDVRISGSLTVNGLLTAVSMSTQYVTSSEYNIGVSRITLNDDDNVRFAGLSIIDSGSSSPTTASILWDSLQHRFIYENLSGSAYNSAIIIAGPKNTGSLGDEQELTTGRITVATGGDHIDNSPARVEGTTVHFDADVYATGSISATSITGSIFGTATTASYVDYANIANKPTLVSSSAQVNTGSFSGDLVGTSSWASNAISSSYAQTASYSLSGTGFPFSGSAVITGSLLVSSSGIEVIGNGITGSLLGTSSVATTAISASHAITASYALNAQSGGTGAGFPFSGSAVITGSLLVSGSTISGSFVGDGAGLTNINISTAVVSDIYKFVGDGSTQLYILSESYNNSSVQVAVDGLLFTEGVDYTYLTGSITFVVAPPSSSNVLVSALLNTQNRLTGSFTGSFIGDGHGLTNLPLAINIETYKFVGDGTTTNYSLNHAYGPNSLFISVGGVMFTNPDDFTVSGTTVTFTEVPASSSNILVRAFQSQSFLGSSSYSTTSSYVDYVNVGNKPTLVSASSQIDVRNTLGIATIATTGSNTFTGIQSISDTTNTTNYLDGALVVAGGVGIGKDLRVSGSVVITGLLTAVSMSTQYVTSSQYNVGVSRITLNDDDTVRFSGLSIYDSGSSSPTTASIFWDSLQHRFIYENLSGSAYNSAIIIAGPKNTGSLGDEQELTTSRLVYATGGDHIDNAPARVAGNTIHFDENIYVTGSVSAPSFTGSILGTATTASYVDYTNIANKPTLISASSQVDVRNTTGIATIATTGSNTFTATQTIIGNVFLSSSFPLVYNNSATNNMLFGLFDGSDIYGAYYQTFGNNYSELNQRGGAEFVYDTRNNSDANFHIASFNGATWTEKFRVNDSGAIVTGSLEVTAGITGSLLGTSSWASNAVSSSYAATASYSLSGTGFPFSGSAVITGSLLVLATGSVGGVTGSFSGSGAGLHDLRSSLALDTYNFVGDGTTVNYVLSQSYTPNSLLVSVEGINYTHIEDFTLSSNTLTFVVAPPTQSNVSIRALLSVSSGSYINYTGSFIGDGYGLDNLRGALAIETNKFIGDGATTNYTLSASYLPQSLLVTVGGLRYIDTNDYTITGNVIQFTQAPASQSIIVAQAYLIISSGSVGTFSGSFLGNATTATSASYATTASFASNVLKTKAGSIVSASFGGTPLSASVTFGTAFGNTNYAIAISGEDARIFTVESKTAGGFVVNTNSNTALTGTTYWTCTAYGEN